MLESTGSYVLFSDQDDGLKTDACARLKRELEAHPVDILQFGTQIVPGAGVSEGELRGSLEWLTPYPGALEGRAILEKCFIEGAFSYSIWNKAYEGTLARKAFAATQDVPVPLGEDNYASFVLDYFAHTYYGLQDVDLYVYHYGRGYTGQGSQSVASFRRTCGLAVACDLIKQFLEAQGTLADNADLCAGARYQMLRYTVDRWILEIAEEDKTAAMEAVLEQWEYPEVLHMVESMAPGKLPHLIRARFGAALDEAAGFEAAADARARASAECGMARLGDLTAQLEDVYAQHQACEERVAAYRRTYTESRAFKMGQRLTAPLRKIRGISECAVAASARTAVLQPVAWRRRTVRCNAE